MNKFKKIIYDKLFFIYSFKKLWPIHCVQNTWGAQIHENIQINHKDIIIYKGTNSFIDSYSAFWDNAKLNGFY